MDLISIFLDSDWNIQVSMNKWIIVVMLLSLLGCLIYMRPFKSVSGRSSQIDEAEMGIVCRSSMSVRTA